LTIFDYEFVIFLIILAMELRMNGKIEGRIERIENSKKKMLFL